MPIRLPQSILRFVLLSALVFLGQTVVSAQITQILGTGGINTLDNPVGIATDGSGNVFVAGGISDNVLKITPGGVVTEVIDASGDGGGNLLDQAWNVAVDTSGNVFVVARDLTTHSGLRLPVRLP